MSDRYAENPFLLLLELFIINSIDSLAQSEYLLLEQMTPVLQSSTGIEGDWEEIIKGVMGWDDSIGEWIDTEWLKEQCKAKINKTTLSPEDFAIALTDKLLTKEQED